MNTKESCSYMYEKRNHASNQPWYRRGYSISCQRVFVPKRKCQHVFCSTTNSTSMTARTQKSWSFSENPGDKSGDQAILEWLQTPHNAARFIRWWNNIAQDDTKTSFSNELGAFVNNNSSPQRTNQSIYKRSERFDELLKDCKDMLSNGVSERGKCCL